MVVDPGPAEPDADEGGDAVEEREHYEPDESDLFFKEDETEEGTEREEERSLSRGGVPPFKAGNDPRDDRDGVAPGDSVGEEEPREESEHQDGEGEAPVEEEDKPRYPEAEDEVDDLPERLVHHTGCWRGTG